MKHENWQAWLSSPCGECPPVKVQREIEPSLAEIQYLGGEGELENIVLNWSELVPLDLGYDLEDVWFKPVEEEYERWKRYQEFFDCSMPKSDTAARLEEWQDEVAREMNKPFDQDA